MNCRLMGGGQHLHFMGHPRHTSPRFEVKVQAQDPKPAWQKLTMLLPLLYLVLLANVMPIEANRRTPRVFFQRHPPDPAKRTKSTVRSAKAAIPQVTTSPAPLPPTWPTQFHAQYFSNRTGRLNLVDLWYDWPNGRNLNLITSQLEVRGVTHDVEYDNHTSFYYDLGRKTCKTIHFDVGILKPDWLTGAKYNGMEVVDNITTHSYTQADGFITYWSEVAPPHRPVKWRFYDGVENQIMSWREGAVLEDKAWQAPPYCFNSSDNTQHSQPEHMDTQHMAMDQYWRRLQRLLQHGHANDAVNEVA